MPQGFPGGGIMLRIAVLDIGKTNAKVLVVDLATGVEEVLARTPNAVVRDGLYPHHDIDMLWHFALDGQFWSHVVPFTALAGVGLGLVVAPLTAAAMQGAEDGEQGSASGINNAVARVAGLVAVALLGRMAASAYGPGAPGFGLTANTPAHLAATGAAFGTVAATASLMAALAAVLALLVGRPVK